MDGKAVRCAVAAVVRRQGERDSFLAVRRPRDDASLPGVWGLPAVTLHRGELPEAGLRRIGREKLGTELEPTRLVGIKAARRETYELILMDIEAMIVGADPDVARATSTGTRYVDQQWTAELAVLREAARRGSLCSQVLLESAGMPYGDEPR